MTVDAANRLWYTPAMPHNLLVLIFSFVALSAFGADHMVKCRLILETKVESEDFFSVKLTSQILDPDRTAVPLRLSSSFFENRDLDFEEQEIFVEVGERARVRQAIPSLASVASVVSAGLPASSRLEVHSWWDPRETYCFAIPHNQLFEFISKDVLKQKNCFDLPLPIQIPPDIDALFYSAAVRFFGSGEGVQLKVSSIQNEFHEKFLKRPYIHTGLTFDRFDQFSLIRFTIDDPPALPTWKKDIRADLSVWSHQLVTLFGDRLIDPDRDVRFYCPDTGEKVLVVELNTKQASTFVFYLIDPTVDVY